MNIELVNSPQQLVLAEIRYLVEAVDNVVRQASVSHCQSTCTIHHHRRPRGAHCSRCPSSAVVHDVR